MSKEKDVITVSPQEEVESILDKKVVNTVVYYKVAWKGYPLSQATWEPEFNLNNCKKLLSKFEKNNKANQPTRHHSQQNEEQCQEREASISTRKRTVEIVGEETKGRKIKNQSKAFPQHQSSKTSQKVQLLNTIKRNLKDRKQKEEQMKQKLAKYSESLPEGKRTSHQMEQINQIYKTVLKLSELREKQFGQDNLKNLRREKWLQRLQRYKKCDQCLSFQKRMTLRNLISKQTGLPTTKHRIKMIEVQDMELLNEQLHSIRKVETECSMDRLQMLIKVRYAWLAVGKDKGEGLFIIDVNLLEESVWKAIEDMYST